MNCWHLRLWRKTICLRFTQDEEERVGAAHRSVDGIVKLRIGVPVFSQLLHTLCRTRAQIIEPPSVRTIAPVGHASRQPASSQCLQTSERNTQRNGSSPSPLPNE